MLGLASLLLTVSDQLHDLLIIHILQLPVWHHPVHGYLIHLVLLLLLVHLESHARVYWCLC